MRNRAYDSQMMGSNMKWRARPASMVSLLKLEQQEQRRKRENAIMAMLILSLLVQVTTLLVLVLTFELPFIADMNSVTSEVPLKLIPRIDKDFPSADIIQAILLEEQHTLVNHNDTATVADMANVYELVYAFISAFQRHAIPIFVGYGSHLGARRHHGIIPFGDENVDLEVFSVDEAKVSAVINEVLHVKDSWSNITVSEIGFGFRLNNETMAKHGFKYYIDFFLFNSNIAKDRHIRCKGLQLGYMNGIRPNPSYGCNRWYRRVHGMSAMPPKFKWSDYFPPLYQVFGSHRVPIPRTSRELETFDYNGDEEHWNTTCGSHRVWLGNSTVGKYSPIPKEGRECAKLYEKYPFVFKAANGTEYLRQGNVVMHKSKLEA